MLIVVIITADIFARWVFNCPIPGSLEVTELVLPLIVFLGIAYAGIEKKHIAIDIFYNKLSTSAQNIIGTFTTLLSCVVMSLMTWRFAQRTLVSVELNEYGDIVGIPYWPSLLMVTIGSGLMLIVLLIELLRLFADLKNTVKFAMLWSLLIVLAAGTLTFSNILLDMFSIQMTNLTIGILFISILMVLMFMKMPIAFAMAFIGFIGVWQLKSFHTAIPLMAIGPWTVATQWTYSVIPTFILMGMFAFYASLSKDLFDAGYRWFGGRPGGLAITTIAACGSFAAICGCSTATAGTMGTIAIPEMERYKYKPELAAGSVAAGGTLGILIPPSLGFMVYGIITEQSIGKLFIAGVIPGIILTALFIISILVRCSINPELGPKAQNYSFKEKLYSLKKTWSMLLLFMIVMGGLYLGYFSPTEAGAIGAFCSLCIGFAMKRLTWTKFSNALLDAGRLTATIFIILCCVKILGYFIALTQIPFLLSNFVISLDLSKYMVILLILILYMVLGMLMNIVPMMVLTLPIVFPMVIGLGFDPIWFGVLMVVMMEMGQITPPVGINAFVVSGVAPQIPMGKIFRGIMPFWFIQIVIIILLVLFPPIATYLPNLMN